MYSISFFPELRVLFQNSSESVSSDFIGSRLSGIIDGSSTIADGSNKCVIYIWYDNEFGYVCQVIRLLKFIACAN